MRLPSGVLVLSCVVAASLALAEAVAQPPPPAAGRQAAAPAAPPSAGVNAPAAEPAPTEPQLGLPIYPGAQFIRSYDAGRGQRYYLFGTAAAFDQVVAFYRGSLKQRGTVVFARPATHMFEVGRYRAETMAFPPGVTVKDFTWGGSAGYPNPLPNMTPQRFPTIVQLVPSPF